MRWQLRGRTLPFHGGEARLQSSEVAGYEQFDMGGGCLSEGRVSEKLRGLLRLNLGLFAVDRNEL